MRRTLTSRRSLLARLDTVLVEVLESRRLLSVATTTVVTKSPADPDYPDLGQPVTISFQVTAPQGDPTPTGTVQLVPDSGTEGASTTTLVAGAGQSVVDLSLAGTHNFTANFVPAANLDGTPSQFAPSSGTVAIFVRPTISTSTTTATVGQSVTFTALLSSYEPTFDPSTSGAVTFYLYGVALPPVQPVFTASKEVLASITLSDLAIGLPVVFAFYQNVPSTIAATHVQAASTTTLAATPSPSAPGQPVTLTALVNAPDAEPFEPTGTVSFTIDGVVQPALTLQKSNLAPGQGTASFTTFSLATGSHAVTATYSGAYFTAGSTSSPINQTVQTPTGALTTTTLASSDLSSAPDSPVTFTALVAGAANPTGFVTFLIDGVPRPAVAVVPTAGAAGQGTASFTTPALGTGVYSVVASYGGDGSSAPSASSAINQVVEFPSTTTIDTVIENPSPNPSAFGAEVSFTAIVMSVAGFSGVPGEPGGNVIFTIDGVAMPPVALTPILGYDANGGNGGTGYSSATFLTATLSSGQHTVIATYTGDVLAAPSTSAPFTQTVEAPGQTVVNLAFSYSPLITGSGNVVEASVNSAVPPTGTVTFLVDGLAQPPRALVSFPSYNPNLGLADFPVEGLGVGPHLISATYSGDASSRPATSPVFLQDVPTPQQVQSFTALGIAPAGTSAGGQAVVVTATVAAPEVPGGVPTGTLTFYDGTTLLEADPLPASGQVTITTPALALGTHTITAIYNGDAGFTASSGAGTQVVGTLATTTTTLLAAPGSSVLGQAVTLIATVATDPAVSHRPVGTVVFYDGSTPLGLAALDAYGQATIVTTLPGAGSQVFTAVYSGDAASATSTATTTGLVVVPAPLAPTVASLQRYGTRLQPTTLVLAFTGPLDPASAQDTNNYRILDARGHQITVRSATYDTAAGTVTLHPSQRLNIHETYKLTVIGSLATGVKGIDGQLLGGAGPGQAGINYTTRITRATLVLPRAAAKLAVHPTATHPSAHLAARHQAARAASRK